MSTRFLSHLDQQLEELRGQGLEKRERSIQSAQSTEIEVKGKRVINLCANNYLGLANHPRILKAAEESLSRWGFGTASVRFICGTQEIHEELESAISRFLKTDDTILYSSCFDANGGLFETLLTEEDAVISDALNHASIIDGIRLCKAKRFRYQNNDMGDLKKQLEAAADARFRLIVTDGVFSMDGSLANLPEVCQLADEHDALLVVDDSHAVGFMGDTGAGTPEYFGVQDRIDIITGTLGKALGGGSGGYTSGRKQIIDWLRQRSRPYLFSNSICPPLVAAGLEALKIVETSPELRNQLHENARFFREEITKLGYRLLPGVHPIVPIMLGDAALATTVANALLERGVYVIGFSFPVVPRGEARIRTQLSAIHTREELEFAIEQFAAVKQELNF